MSLNEWLNQFKKSTTTQPALDIYFLGDGVGESIIGILENHFVFVIDAYGGTETSITKTFLNALGIKKIDFLQVSHLHQDHYSGFHSLIDSFEIISFGRPNLAKYQEIVSVTRFIEIKTENSMTEKPTSIINFLSKVREKRDRDWSANPNAYLHLGNSSLIYEKTFGGETFKVDCIAPIASSSERFLDDIEKEVKKLEEKGASYIGAGFLNKFDPAINRTSVVNRIQYGKAMVLLTGDTEASIIDAYKASTVSNQASELKTLLIKVPHHGSTTSDADLFFESKIAISGKKIAVISPYNSQGLPENEVEKKYLDSGYDLFRTSNFSGRPSDSFNQDTNPSGVVRVRLESNGQSEVSAWGSAAQISS